MALAWQFAQRGADVTIWCRREERRAEIAAGRHSLLPGVRVPTNVQPVCGVAGLAEMRPPTVAISAVPVQKLREVLRLCSASLPRSCPWVSASKGIEIGTLQRPSEILQDYELGTEVAVLSGPSHAEEVVRAVPTAVSLGHTNVEIGRRLQELLSGDTFRVYYNSDPVGVEWAGALKNVIALAAGIAVGCGFGDNSLAALITRGSVEIGRLGTALGGRRETFGGLAGIGDLIGTCFSSHSRNRSVGLRIGRGEAPATVLSSMVQVAEGVPTSKAVFELSQTHGLELPISEVVYRIVHLGQEVQEGIQNLLTRSLKSE